jgi:K+-sensing histidine kinase KdpD
MDYRGTIYLEMDLAAIIARRPEVVLVDELTHTNIGGSRHDKRWQDVEEILAAGIHVITTVNIQHLESLNNVVESITRVRQRETVPDRMVRQADAIELGDMSPQSLRRRMAHGNIYASEKVDAALGQYREKHDIDSTWVTRERIVVAVTGGPESAALPRRAARIASRGAGGVDGPVRRAPRRAVGLDTRPAVEAAHDDRGPRRHAAHRRRRRHRHLAPGVRPGLEREPGHHRREPARTRRDATTSRGG